MRAELLARVPVAAARTLKWSRRLLAMHLHDIGMATFAGDDECGASGTHLVDVDAPGVAERTDLMRGVNTHAHAAVGKRGECSLRGSGPA